jgi:hypothetical protein
LENPLSDLDRLNKLEFDGGVAATAKLERIWHKSETSFSPLGKDPGTWQDWDKGTTFFAMHFTKKRGKWTVNITRGGYDPNFEKGPVPCDRIPDESGVVPVAKGAVTKRSEPEAKVQLIQMIVIPPDWSEETIIPSDNEQYRLWYSSDVEYMIDGEIRGDSSSLRRGSSIRVRSKDGQPLSATLKLFQRPATDAEMKGALPVLPLPQLERESGQGKKTGSPQDSFATKAVTSAGHPMALQVTAVTAGGAMDTVYGLRTGDVITSVGDVELNALAAGDAEVAKALVVSEGYQKKKPIIVQRGTENVTLSAR